MPLADVVFTGGTVFTAPWDRSRPRDVAVRDGAIVAIGEPGALAEMTGPVTEIVDLTGRMLLPGFQDAHVHPVQAGVELLQCDLTGAADADDCLRIVARVRDCASRRAVDPRRRLVDGVLPRRHPDARSARSRRARPAGRAQQP